MAEEYPLDITEEDAKVWVRVLMRYFDTSGDIVTLTRNSRLIDRSDYELMRDRFRKLRT